MSKLKMNCGYCGRKCSLEKDFCIPQDSVYVCKSCYEWQNRVADLEFKLAESESKYKKAYQEGLLQKQFDKDVEIMQLKQQLAEKDQDKISFAVGQLIFFKYSIEDELKTKYVFSIENVREIFDNQIKQLKEGK